MSEPAALAAENAELREQVEAFRHRELAELREQLAQAKGDVVHYRAEAQRNADLGRQIHAEAQSELESLRARLNSFQVIPNARISPAE